MLNVAAGKAPMQISTEGTGIPQKAIDGSTSAFFQADTCSLTKPEKAPWWYVNLLEPYMVQLVRLDFGKACCGEFPRNEDRFKFIFNSVPHIVLHKCMMRNSILQFRSHSIFAHKVSDANITW